MSNPLSSANKEKTKLHQCRSSSSVTFGFVDNVIYSPYCLHLCHPPPPLVLLATPFIYSTKCSADTQYISNIYNVQEELLQLNKTTLVYMQTLPTLPTPTQRERFNPKFYLHPIGSHYCNIQFGQGVMILMILLCPTNILHNVCGRYRQ